MVSVRPTINQSSQTIDAVIAKMQQSHIQFLNLIDEDFLDSGFPEAALAPLRMLQSAAKIRQPSWFNRTINYKRASEDALRAKHNVLYLLNSDKTWEDARSKDDVDGDGILDRVTPAQLAEHLFDAAKLCAREGELEIAIRSLQLSLQSVGDKEADHPKLTKEDVTRVEQVLQEMVAAGCFPRRDSTEGLGNLDQPPSLTSAGQLSKQPGEKRRSLIRALMSEKERVRERMLLMQMLLKTDKESNLSAVEMRRVSDDDANPWVATIVAIAVEDEPSMDGLVRLLERAQLVRKAPLAKGSRVLGCREEETWEEGTVKEVREVRTAEEAATLSMEDGPTSPSRGGDISDREKSFNRKFKPYTRYTVRVSKEETLTTRDAVPFGSGGGGAMLRGAAREGHDLLVSKLLAAGVCVHEANPRAETALHLAARGEARHASVCEMLVKAGANGFQYSTSGSRAYDLAVSSGSQEVRLAIKPSKDDKELTACTKDRSAPWLVLAASKDERALTNALNPKYSGPERGLRRQDSSMKATNAAGESTMGEAEGVGTTIGLNMSASTMRAAAMITKRKGEIKADINKTGPHNVTALMLASRAGWQPCVQRLLLMGANRLLATSSGCTSLTIAAREGHSTIVKELLLQRTTEFEDAAEGGDGGEAYANQAEESDVTALMRAAQGGFVKVSELLLNAKALVDTVRTDTRRTALIAAARNGHTDVVILLMEWGAKGDLVDNKGMNVLASAAAFGQVGVINAIGEKLGIGENMPQKALEQADVKGQTPLLIALRYGHDAAAHSLLQLGAKVNVFDRTGLTPLAMVCKSGHNTAIPALLDFGGELERANNAKHTPLMLCCLAGNEEAMDMLLTKGAKASARGPEGKTALMLAAAAGHSGAVKLLVTATKSKVSLTSNSPSPQPSPLP